MSLLDKMSLTHDCEGLESDCDTSEIGRYLNRLKGMAYIKCMLKYII